MCACCVCLKKKEVFSAMFVSPGHGVLGLGFGHEIYGREKENNNTKFILLLSHIFKDVSLW